MTHEPKNMKRKNPWNTSGRQMSHPAGVAATNRVEMESREQDDYEAPDQQAPATPTPRPLDASDAFVQSQIEAKKTKDAMRAELEIEGFKRYRKEWGARIRTEVIREVQQKLEEQNHKLWKNKLPALMASLREEVEKEHDGEMAGLREELTSWKKKYEKLVAQRGGNVADGESGRGDDEADETGVSKTQQKRTKRQVTAAAPMSAFKTQALAKFPLPTTRSRDPSTLRFGSNSRSRKQGENSPSTAKDKDAANQPNSAESPIVID